MVSARVTARFYHDLGLSVLIVVGTIIMVAGALWLARLVDDGKPSAMVTTPLIDRGRGYRLLYIGLGLLWILDGLLQLQPDMPNSAFLEMVIGPLLSGQPAWFIHVLGTGIQTWSNAPIVANLMAVWIQLGIGLILLMGRNRPWGRWGLWLTLVWGSVVWTWGEGWGLIMTRYVSWLAGDPGSALIYMLAAVLLLTPNRCWRSGQASRWVSFGLAAYWLVGAIFQTLPTSIFWKQLSGIFLVAAQTAQPGWISLPIYQVARWTAFHSFVANGMTSLLMSFLGLVWIVRPYSRLTRMATLGALFLMWWLGQDFGVLGGLGTDPQIAPVVALILMAGYLNHRDVSRVPERLNTPIEADNGISWAGSQERP